MKEVPLSGSEPGLDKFNTLAPFDALAELVSCCAAPDWAAELTDGRPYPALAELLDRADAALAELDQAQLALAMAGHPRIGERSAHPSSRREQASVTLADPEVLAALADGNRVYEQRFGHVYLVCAAGRSAEELLRVLRERLDNDQETEHAVLRRELGQINRLRLRRMVTGE
jgi:2-oxo-4-hydroxy-4-carboxy-5-ureidoimidazoline decarboxylase